MTMKDQTNASSELHTMAWNAGQRNHGLYIQGFLLTKLYGITTTMDFLADYELASWGYYASTSCLPSSMGFWVEDIEKVTIVAETFYTNIHYVMQFHKVTFSGEIFYMDKH